MEDAVGCYTKGKPQDTCSLYWVGCVMRCRSGAHDRWGAKPCCFLGTTYRNSHVKDCQIKAHTRGGEEATLGWGVENCGLLDTPVYCRGGGSTARLGGRELTLLCGFNQYTLLQNRDNSGLLGTPLYCSPKLGGRCPPNAQVGGAAAPPLPPLWSLPCIVA